MPMVPPAASAPVDKATSYLYLFISGTATNPMVTAVATLELGIGANAALFTAVESALLRALPYHDTARLAMVWEDTPPSSVSRRTRPRPPTGPTGAS